MEGRSLRLARGGRSTRLDATLADVLDATAAAIDVATVVVTGDGRIAMWNDAAERLLGWSAAEAVDAPLSAVLVGPADGGRTVGAGSAAEWNGALRCRRRDGEVVTVDATSVALPHGDPDVEGGGRDGAGGGAVLALRDRGASADAVESEARARALLAAATETVVVLDHRGSLKAVSPSVERAGFAARDLVAGDVSPHVHPDDLDDVRAAVRSVRRDATLRPTVLYRSRSADGVWRWGEATMTNLLHDPVIGGIVVNVRDVDERERSRARMAAVINRSSDVALFFAADGTVAWASPALAEVFGVDPEVVEGVDAMRFVAPDDRPEVARSLGGTMGALGDHVAIECRVVLPDGSVRWVEMVATNLLDDPDVGFIVANLRDVTDRRAAGEQLERLALVDELTGLPNRNALVDATAAAIDRAGADREVGIVFFDIDDFCDVNDTLGHVAGDALLVAISRRVGGAVGGADDGGPLLARFGGDQFAVLCPDVADLSAALETADAVQAALAAPFVLGDREVFVAVSQGVAVTPVDCVDDLLRHADTALYRAKRAGRGRTVVFEDEQGAASLHRLVVSSELRRGIERREIIPRYQPVVDLRTGRVVAVEALARWDHPDHGPISPSTFIPVAETTELIGDLGSQVLDRACRHTVGWMDDGRRLQLAVNASALQLMDPEFPERVAAVLERTGLPPEQLTLEITETAALRDMSVAVVTLAELGERGVALSLDDFGTGYSSLSLLKRLPVGALKIDRGFVRGLGSSPDDEQIVSGVLGLALALGFDVVGEGVETPAQAEFLRRIGCHYAQGYLWSAAVPADGLLDTIEEIERGVVEVGTGAYDPGS